MIADIAAPNTAAGIILKCLLRLIMMKVTASVNAEINANISPSQTPDCKPSPATNITPVIPAMIAAHVGFGIFSLRMTTDSSAAMRGVEWLSHKQSLVGSAESKTAAGRYLAENFGESKLVLFLFSFFNGILFSRIIVESNC